MHTSIDPFSDGAEPLSGAPAAFIYLASQSPRRQELLRQLGVRFELLLADQDEDAEALEAEQPGETPDAYVLRVCAAKAAAALARHAARGLAAAPILAADTTVALDGRIFGKPTDAAHAVHMLSSLAGRSHRVLSAVTLVAGGTVDAAGAPPASAPLLSVSTVRMGLATAAQIERYVASGEALGKAGAYAIQGRAAEFIEHIDGSYSGIMGLPLCETAALLRAARVRF